MRKHSVLLLFILLVLTPITAFANAGAPQVVQTNTFNSVFIPVKNDTVSIVKEDLKYVIQSGKTGYLADVSVNYKMFNDSDKVENLTLVFPMSALSDQRLNFDVLFDGKKVDVQYEWMGDINDTENASNIQDITFKEMLDAYNSRNKESNYNSIALAIFKLDFLPQTNHELQVNYIEKPRLYDTYDLYGPTTEEISYRYFLEPARYWKSFSNLNITIDTPLGYSLFEYTLGGAFKKRGGVYRAHFDALPKANLVFQIRPWFKLRFIHVILIAIGLVLLYIALMDMKVFKAKRKRNRLGLFDDARMSVATFDSLRKQASEKLIGSIVKRVFKL